MPEVCACCSVQVKQGKAGSATAEHAEARGIESIESFQHGAGKRRGGASKGAERQSCESEPAIHQQVRG